MAEERYTIAVMFRAFLQSAERMGLREEICRSAPQEIAQMFAKPPLPTAMVPGSVCDAFYEAVTHARGRDALRAIAYQSMRDEGSKLLGGLFKNSMALYGQTPDALFGQIDTIIGPVVSQIIVSYAPESPRAGVVEVRPAGHSAPLSYAVWEGYLEYFFDVCGVHGTVDTFVLAPDGRSGRCRVSW